MLGRPRERSASDLDVGSLVARRYRLLEVVGRGGSGTVYRAHDRELDEIVALKLLLREMAPAAAPRSRCRR